MFQKIHKSNEIIALFLAGILNPWTGEPIHLSEDQDENSAPDGKSQFQIIILELLFTVNKCVSFL